MVVVVVPCLQSGGGGDDRSAWAASAVLLLLVVGNWEMKILNSVVSAGTNETRWGQDNETSILIFVRLPRMHGSVS